MTPINALCEWHRTIKKETPAECYYAIWESTAYAIEGCCTYLVLVLTCWKSEESEAVVNMQYIFFKNLKTQVIACFPHQQAQCVVKKVHMSKIVFHWMLVNVFSLVNAKLWVSACDRAYMFGLSLLQCLFAYIDSSAISEVWFANKA